MEKKAGHFGPWTHRAMDTLDLDLRHMGRTLRRLIIGLSDSESVIVEEDIVP